MALFSRTEKKEETKVVVKDTKVAAKAAAQNGSKATDRNLASVLRKPRITEKAVSKSEQNVYTFVVRPDATKHDVRDAIKALYNVTPVKVNIVNKTARQMMSRTKGRVISQKGMKKAYVYLKDGDTINLV